MNTDMEVDEVIEEEESEFETEEEVEEILEEDEDGEDEDTTSIIDHHLGEMVFRRSFINETGLVYNEEEGTVMFKQDDEKITFKMPHTMKTFKQTRDDELNPFKDTLVFRRMVIFDEKTLGSS
ncbi:hypothetical protein Tco_1215204 [Tanacetum coccineum]